MKPTKNQLMLAPRLAVWEFEEFFRCLRVVRQYRGFGGTKGRDKNWSDAFELLHVHARILVDFFTKQPKERDKPRRDDDVICKDFGFRRAGARRLDPNSALKKRCNKRLAHLSYRRFHKRYQPIPNIGLLERECFAFLRCSKVYAFVEGTVAYPHDRRNRERRRQGKVRWDALLRRLRIPRPRKGTP